MSPETLIFYIVRDSDSMDGQAFTCSAVIRGTWECIDYIVDRVATTFKHRPRFKIWCDDTNYDITPIIDSLQCALDKLYRPLMQDVL